MAKSDYRKSLGEIKATVKPKMPLFEKERIRWTDGNVSYYAPAVPNIIAAKASEIVSGQENIIRNFWELHFFYSRLVQKNATQVYERQG